MLTPKYQPLQNNVEGYSQVDLGPRVSDPGSVIKRFHAQILKASMHYSNACTAMNATSPAIRKSAAFLYRV